ncbi:hypothetical protein ACFPM0_10805 [Pseudonocardia sulfidoxydans]|uniref:hypothetical protein n=1 Tax=Pseudonocardia sulfidoxydans TaxID=54011 RepID=UPI00360AEDC7
MRLPTGVRTASTITASRTSASYRIAVWAASAAAGPDASSRTVSVDCDVGRGRPPSAHTTARNLTVVLGTSGSRGRRNTGGHWPRQ